MKKKPLTDAEIRQLRASIYGEISDASWEKVKSNWSTTENAQWLLEHRPTWPQPEPLKHE